MLKENIKFFIMNSIYTFKANNSDYTFLYYSISKIINPILQLLFFYYIQLYVRQGENIDIYIIGNLMLLSIPNSVFSLAKILTFERTYGTLKLIEISSGHKFLIYVSRAFFYILESFVSIIISLLFSIFFLDLQIDFFMALKLIGVMLITNFSLMGFGVLIGSFGVLLRSILLLVNTCYLLLIAFSGANYSITTFPENLQRIIVFLPLQRGIEVAKNLYLYKSFNYQLLFQEFVIGCIFYILGYIFLKYLTKKAKQYGSFDIY